MAPLHPANELSATQQAGGVASPDDASATSTGPTDSWAGAAGCPVDVASEQSGAAREGRFEIRRPLGSGGFGAVHLAWDRLLLREVAIKRPRGKLAASAERNFLHEARSAARIRHPGIVVVHDVGVDEAGPFIVYEYVEGGSLKARLDGKPWPVDDALKFCLAIAEALTEAHKQGLTHRDLKPANILINHAGRPQIADFGLALHADQQESHRGEVAGTYKYMAPEQVLGQAERVDGRTDLWALGVILYELLTGRQPFAGTDTEVREQILSRDPRPPRQWVETIPPAVASLVLELLAKNQAARPGSAGNVADELRRLMQVTEAAAAGEIAPRAHPSRSLVGVLPIALVAVVAMLSFVVIVWILGNTNSPGELVLDSGGNEKRIAALENRGTQAHSKYRPSVWTPLLESEPLPILSAQDAKWEFKPGSLTIQSAYPALIELGEIWDEKFSIRLGVKASEWNADAGLFVGFAPAVDDPSADETLLISLVERDTGKLLLDRRIATLQRAGLQYPTKFFQLPPGERELSPRADGWAELQVDVVDRRVQSVFLNGTRIPFASSRETLATGKFGVYLLGGSSSYSNAAIRVTP